MRTLHVISTRLLFIAFGLLLQGPGQLRAQGALDPPAGPNPSMKSLQQIWDKLVQQQIEINELQAENQLLQQQNSAIISALGLQLPWNITTIDSNNDVGQFASMALGPDGQPAISYTELNGNGLRYAKRVNGTWQVSRVDPATEVGSNTSLVFLANGLPAIAYYDSAKGDLKFATQHFSPAP